MNTDEHLKSIAKNAAKNIIIGIFAALLVVAVGFGMMFVSAYAGASNPVLLTYGTMVLAPVLYIYPVVRMYMTLHEYRVQNRFLIALLTLVSLFVIPIAAPLIAYFGITKLGKE